MSTKSAVKEELPAEEARALARLLEMRLSEANYTISSHENERARLRKRITDLEAELAEVRRFKRARR